MYYTTTHIAPTVSFLKVLYSRCSAWSVFQAEPPPPLHHLCQASQLAGVKVKSSTWMAHTPCMLRPSHPSTPELQWNVTPQGVGEASRRPPRARWHDPELQKS